MEFHQPNAEALDADRSKDARQVAEQGGVKAFYLQAGVTNVRILPPFSAKGVWYRELYEYNVVVDGQRRVFTAPIDGPDPIEEKRQALLQAGGDFNIKAAEGLKATRRYLFNALVWFAPPGVEFTRGEVVVLKAPVTVKRHLLEMDRDVQGGWADITNPASGVNIKVSRTGKGLNTEYSVAPLPKRSDLSADLAAVQVDVNSLKLFNLDELYQPLSYDDLKRVASKIGNVVVPAAAVPAVLPTAVQFVPVQGGTTPTVQFVPTATTAVVPPVNVMTATVSPEAYIPGMDIPPPPPAIR